MQIKRSNLQGFGRKALLPISVDNPAFSTRLMTGAIKSITSNYSEIVVLIADDIQIYNKVLKTTSGAELAKVFLEFDRGNSYFVEKSRWFGKIIRQTGCQLKDVKWTIKRVSDITDQKFYEILRRVAILYQTDAEFRSDISHTAYDFCKRTKGDASEKALNLSRAYLIEEIAINIRLRVLERLVDEYYAFNYPIALVKLYRGAYGITPDQLAAFENAEEPYRFYTFLASPKPMWQDVSIPHRG